MLVSYKPLAAQIAADSRLPTSVARACIAALKQKKTVYFHTKEPCCPTRAARQLSEMNMRVCAWYLLPCLSVAAETGRRLGFVMDNDRIRTAVAAWLSGDTATYGLSLIHI